MWTRRSPAWMRSGWCWSSSAVSSIGTGGIVARVRWFVGQVREGRQAVVARLGDWQIERRYQREPDAIGRSVILFERKRAAWLPKETSHE